LTRSRAPGATTKAELRRNRRYGQPLPNPGPFRPLPNRGVQARALVARESGFPVDAVDEDKALVAGLRSLDDSLLATRDDPRVALRRQVQLPYSRGSRRSRPARKSDEPHIDDVKQPRPC
jgi:hypothetical protein